MVNVAIIVGAGKGRRIGYKDKSFLLLKKKPILLRSILPFEKSSCIDKIILVVRKNKINLAERMVKEYKFRKIWGIIPGGRGRQDSVYNALKKIDKLWKKDKLEADETGYILVHDAARPLVKEQLILRVLNAAKKFGAAIPAVPLRDTVKAGGKFVEKTIRRDTLWLVQTPQAFEYKILKKAYGLAMKKRKRFYATDDALLVENIGCKIKVIQGDSKNIKITFPSDLAVADALCENLKKWGR